jgi:HD-like signal output (HDOD) protein
MSPESRTSENTLDDLLRRMQQKTDFPALSDAVLRIHSVVNSERESVASLTTEILKDVALTNKLLRMVNSAVYAQHGRINTVSRAVSVVGFNAVRNLALSLVLLEHMPDQAQAAVLKEEYLRALMAGSLATELSTDVAEGEEAFLASMFQNLGRLLAEFYLPEEARQVRDRLAVAGAGESETAVSTQVLGLSYELLGLGGAKAWRLPPNIQNCMRRPVGNAPGQLPPDPQLRMRWTAQAANDVADALLHSPTSGLEPRLMQLARQYAATLGRNEEQFGQAIDTARQKLIELATVMDLKVRPDTRAAKLLAQPGSQPQEAPPGPQDSLMGSLDGTELHSGDFAQSAEDEAAREPDPSTDPQSLLAAGIQDVTLAMLDDFKLSDVLRMVLETLYRALTFRRVVFCLRDPKTGVLVGRFGLGDPVPGGVGEFKVTLAQGGQAGRDVLSAVCQKGADTLIEDTSDPRLAPRLPPWYRQTLDAPTFLLLPLMVKGSPVGLIYADKAKAGSIVLDGQVLAMARTLRNQAIMALKQSG